MIFLICGSKPMSSMRSASSSTRYVHRRRLVLPASRKSISLPGVAIQISAPRSSSSDLWSFLCPTVHTAVSDSRRMPKFTGDSRYLLSQFSGGDQNQALCKKKVLKFTRLAVKMTVSTFPKFRLQQHLIESFCHRLKQFP